MHTFLVKTDVKRFLLILDKLTSSIKMHFQISRFERIKLLWVSICVEMCTIQLTCHKNTLNPSSGSKSWNIASDVIYRYTRICKYL